MSIGFVKCKLYEIAKSLNEGRGTIIISRIHNSPIKKPFYNKSIHYFFGFRHIYFLHIVIIMEVIALSQELIIT